MATLTTRFRVFAEGGPGSVKRAGEFGVDKFGGGWAANLVCFANSYFPHKTCRGSTPRLSRLASAFAAALY